MNPRQISRYRSLAKKLPIVLAVSDAVNRNCVELEGMAPEKVRTVVNGIDLARFAPLDAAARERKRAELGVAAEELLLLFVGRLARIKGPDLFVDLLERLLRRGLPVRGFMCGDGDLGAVLGLRQTVPEHVQLLGSRSDIPQLLGAADLFVSTSRNEGLPLNIMEAMATGTAFVAPNLPQVAQLASGRPDLTGGLYPQLPAEGEPLNSHLERWAEVTASRLRDPGLRRQCGVVGRAVIAERYSYAQMLEEHEEIYAFISARTALSGRLHDR